mgnify:CR=1 FL=1
MLYEKNVILGGGNLSIFYTNYLANSQNEFWRFDPELSDFYWANLPLCKAHLDPVNKVREELGETDTTTNLLSIRHNLFFAEGRTSCRPLEHLVGVASQNIYSLEHRARFLGNMKVIAHVPLKLNMVKSQVTPQLRPVPLLFKFFRIVEKTGFQQIL